MRAPELYLNSASGPGASQMLSHTLHYHGLMPNIHPGGKYFDVLSIWRTGLPSHVIIKGGLGCRMIYSNKSDNKLDPVYKILRVSR